MSGWWPLKRLQLSNKQSLLQEDWSNQSWKAISLPGCGEPIESWEILLISRSHCSWTRPTCIVQAFPWDSIFWIFESDRPSSTAEVPPNTLSLTAIRRNQKTPEFNAGQLKQTEPKIMYSSVFLFVRLLMLMRWKLVRFEARRALRPCYRYWTPCCFAVQLGMFGMKTLLILFKSECIVIQLKHIPTGISASFFARLKSSDFCWRT